MAPVSVTPTNTTNMVFSAGTGTTENVTITVENANPEAPAYYAVNIGATIWR